jgi:hypothetical protein
MTGTSLPTPTPPTATLPTARVQAETDARNLASARVPEKLGHPEHRQSRPAR